MKNLAHMTNYKTMGLTYNWTILLDKKKKKREKKTPTNREHTQLKPSVNVCQKGRQEGKTLKTIFFCLYHSRFIAECACENSVCDY